MNVFYSAIGEAHFMQDCSYKSFSLEINLEFIRAQIQCMTQNKRKKQKTESYYMPHIFIEW